MKIAVCSFLIGGLLVAGADVARAEGSSWFGLGKSSSGAKTTKVSSTKNSGMLSGVTNGTKNLVNGTKAVFTPKKKPSVRKGGTTAIHPAKKTPTEKQGFFSSLVNPQPPPPPKTIKEYMELKQIHP